MKQHHLPSFAAATVALNLIKRLGASASLMALMSAINLTPAATVSLLPVADTALFENAPTNNLGAQTFMPVGMSSVPSRNRGLMRFALGEIPTNATLNIVALSITSVTGMSQVAVTFDLHTLLQPWVEGTKSGGASGIGSVGAAATTGEPTWSNRQHPSTAWGSPGAASGLDYSPTASASVDIGDVGNYTFSSAALIADVQRWLTNSSTNFGWLLKDRSETTGGTARRVAAREDPANAPMLTVTYTLSATSVRINPALVNNQMELRFAATANQTYVVEYRALVDAGPWSALTNIIATSDQTIIVRDAVNQSQRYYRLRLQ